jgi:hypothetical protein
VSTTVIGQLLDSLGQAARTEQTVIPNNEIGFDVRLEHRAWATPCDEVRRYQAARIPILEGHDYGLPLGEVRHLELRGRYLWAVGELDDDYDLEALPPLWFSAATNHHRDGSDILIDHVGIVEATAQIGTEPIRFLPGELRHPEVRQKWRLAEGERAIVERAADTARFRRDGSGPITVHDQASESRAPWQAIERQRHDLGTHMRGKLEYSKPFAGILRVR